MISLDKIKIVLWDFDDTLCIHEFHGNNPENEHQYNVNILLYGKDAWSAGKVNIHVKKFMTLCMNRGITQGLISATRSYKHAIGKCDWVKENYGVELENYCVGDFEAKLDMMLTIEEAYNYKRDEILIVDDFWKNLERAANNGFQACSPMEIVNFIMNLPPMNRTNEKMVSGKL